MLAFPRHLAEQDECGGTSGGSPHHLRPQQREDAAGQPMPSPTSRTSDSRLAGSMALLRDNQSGDDPSPRDANPKRIPPHPDIVLVESLSDVRRKLLPADASRRACQSVFLKNDIVWVCTACKADEMCVLCNDCFRSSDHEGHEGTSLGVGPAKISSSVCRPSIPTTLPRGTQGYPPNIRTSSCKYGNDNGGPLADFFRREGAATAGIRMRKIHGGSTTVTPWTTATFCKNPLEHKFAGLITAGSKLMNTVRTFLLDTADAILRCFDLADPWRTNSGRAPKVGLAATLVGKAVLGCLCLLGFHEHRSKGALA